MSRALTALAVVLVLLAACSPYPRDVAGNTRSHGASLSSVEQWLELERKVAAMSRQDIVARLVRVNRPESVGQLYYYGLLNHHLETYGAWTLARDSFREVLESEQLSTAQRQLVTVLEAYEQARINAYLEREALAEQNQSLRGEAEAARQLNEELEQKLQALTELETDISTRKGQD
jgi:hypothetical protein